MLDIRCRFPEVFLSVKYIVLPVQSARSAHVLAFLLCHEDCHVIVVAPRLLASGIDTTSGDGAPKLAPDFWEDTGLVLPRRYLGAALHDGLADVIVGVSADGPLKTIGRASCRDRVCQYV